MELSRTERALQLRNQTIAGNIIRLFQMLVDIYGGDINSLDKVKKREGQEVEIHFNALDTILTVSLSKTRLGANMGPSDKAVASVILTMKKEKIIPTINNLIRTKNNTMGLIKVLLKYVLPGKIKLKGSLGAAIKIIKLLSIGSHPMYKSERIRL